VAAGLLVRRRVRLGVVVPAAVIESLIVALLVISAVKVWRHA
jgi:hypothetical protein